MDNIGDCIVKALGSIGAFLCGSSAAPKASKTETPEPSATEQTQSEYQEARDGLDKLGCLGRKRAPLTTVIILTALLIGALYVEMHFFAVFAGIALILALMSYFTIQRWIDIVGHNDLSDKPWPWPTSGNAAPEAT